MVAEYVVLVVSVSVHVVLSTSCLIACTAPEPSLPTATEFVSVTATLIPARDSVAVSPEIPVGVCVVEAQRLVVVPSLSVEPPTAMILGSSKMISVADVVEVAIAPAAEWGWYSVKVLDSVTVFRSLIVDDKVVVRVEQGLSGRQLVSTTLL